MGKLKFYVVSLLALVLSFVAMPALADDDETTTYSYSDLTTLLSSFEDYTFDDTALGCYSVSGYTAETINSALTTAQALTESSDDSDITASYTTLNAILTAGFTLNLPEKGSFIRIQSNAHSGYYLTSTNHSTQTSCAAFTDDGTGAETIFYYDADGCLENFSTGYYFVSNGTSGIYYDGIVDPLDFTFESGSNFTGSSNGTYTVNYSSTAYTLFCGASNDYCGGAAHKTAGIKGYTFLLEYVDALPYTTNSAGYATIYSPVALTIPDGITAVYTVAIDGDGEATTTQVSDITIIPAETPVLVQGTANTTYSFTITSEEGTAIEESSMGGQIATALATLSNQYTLTDAETLSFTASTVGKTELQGFTAYVVGEASYTANDVKTAWNELIGDYTVGDALGEYSATISGSDDYTDYASLLTAVEELIESESATSSDYAAMLTTLNSITISFTINPVEAGMFIRISPQASGYYLGADNSESSTSRAEYIEDGTTAETIFYYDGTYLLNYSNGYYLRNNSSYLGYNGIQSSGAVFTFSEGLATGQYFVKFGSRYLYGGSSDTYTNAGNSVGSDTAYDFNLYEVTSLPVTTDEAGYATLYAPVALTVPDGVTLHSVDITSATDVTYELSEALSVTTLPANTAVLVKGNASETYTFTIAESSDETVTTSMGGQVAAAYATGYEYVLSDDATELAFTSTTSETELGGFSAYAVLNDGIDWVALQEALDSYDAASIGEDLGEYLPEGYTYAEISALYETIADYTYGDASLDADAVNENVSTLATALTSLTINTPTAGMFIRISPQASGYYLGADNSESSTSRAEYIEDGTTAETIFYYDGTYLLNYSNGYYLRNNSSYLGYNGIQSSGAVFTFSEGLATGQYFVKFGSRYLYGGSSDTYTNAGNSVGSDTAYDFNLYEVTSLPVTTDEAGYATLYAPVALTVPDGVTVQSVVVSNYAGTSFTATDLEEQTTIPANTAVLIVGTASTTYEFEITTSDATVTTAMSGQLATVYASGEEYFLDYDEDNSAAAFTLATADETELQGFTAYTTYEDGIDWDALEEAIDAFIGTYTIGTGLGEYTSTDDYTTETLAALISTAENYSKNQDLDADVVNGATTTLVAALAGLSLNMPEDGTFIRIKANTSASGMSDGYYFTSSNDDTNDPARVALVNGNTGDNEAGTIFYYDGTYLINYENGYYVAMNSDNMIYYDGITTGTVVSFADGQSYSGTTGTYRIYYNNKGRSLFAGNSHYYADGAGANPGSGAGYAFYLEEVESLPVTPNADGYATIYAPVALEIPEGVTVYDVDITNITDETTGTTEYSLTEIENVTVLPANTAVVLYTTDTDSNIDLTITTAEASNVTSDDGGILAAEEAAGTQCVLTYDDDTSASTFTQVAGGTELSGFSLYAVFVLTVEAGVKGTVSEDGTTAMFNILANNSQVMPWSTQTRYRKVFDDPEGYLGKHSASTSVADSLFTYWSSFSDVNELADTDPYLIMSCGVYNNLSLSWEWPADEEDSDGTDSVFVARTGKLPNGEYCPYYLLTADGWHITDVTITYRSITEINDDDEEVIDTCYVTGYDGTTWELTTEDTTIEYEIEGEEQQIIAFTTNMYNSTSDGVLIREILVNVAQDEDYESHVNLFKTNFYASDATATFGEFKPYSNPALAGYGQYVVAVVQQADDYDTTLGDGQIDLVYSFSSDGGATFSEPTILAEGSSTTGYSDAAIMSNFIEDTESDVAKVVMFASYSDGEGVSYDNSGRIKILRFESSDYGETWGDPTDVTDDIYGLIDDMLGSTTASAYIPAGRLCQSRIVKISDYYRLYAGIRAKGEDGIDRNFLLASDDFGQSWSVVGDAPAISSGAGEPKVEELPTGSVVLSSSTAEGRIINIYTFTKDIDEDGNSVEPASLDGYWGTAAESTSETNGTASVYESNNDIIILPVVDSEGNETYLAMQSMSPESSAISDETPAGLGIYYKELSSTESYYEPSAYASGTSSEWNFRQISKIASGGASLVLSRSEDEDGEATYTLCYIFEEENFGPKSDYTIVYHGYTIEDITDGAYSYNEDYVWGTESGFDLEAAGSYLDVEYEAVGDVGKYVGMLASKDALATAKENYEAYRTRAWYEYYHYLLQNATYLTLDEDTYYRLLNYGYNTTEGGADTYGLTASYDYFLTYDWRNGRFASTPYDLGKNPDLFRFIKTADYDEDNNIKQYYLLNVGTGLYVSKTPAQYNYLTGDEEAAAAYIVESDVYGHSVISCVDPTSTTYAALHSNAGYNIVPWTTAATASGWYIEPLDVMDSEESGAISIADSVNTVLATKRGLRISERTELKEALATYEADKSITTFDALYKAIFDFYQAAEPQAGTFYRLKGAYSGNYISSGETGSGNSARIVMESDGDESVSSIYYYGDDNTLVNYYDGMAVIDSQEGYYLEDSPNEFEFDAEPLTAWTREDNLAFDTYTLTNTTQSKYVWDSSSKIDRWNTSNYSSISDYDQVMWTVEEVEAIPVKISSSAGYGTIICPVALQIPDGVKAYTATADWDAAVVTLTEITDDYIPANTGVVVGLTEDASSDDGYYDFTIIDDAGTEGSDMHGYIYTHDINDDDDHYILTLKNGVVQFRRATFETSNYIAGSKAYFTGSLTSSSSEAAAAGLELRFTTVVDDVTGIEETIVTVDDGAPYYDLQGRVVKNPTGGIYIHNGRKVYVK